MYQGKDIATVKVRILHRFLMSRFNKLPKGEGLK